MVTAYEAYELYEDEVKAYRQYSAFAKLALTRKLASMWRRMANDERRHANLIARNLLHVHAKKAMV